jgi:two-component system chemotaxis response regulator CheB
MVKVLIVDDSSFVRRTLSVMLGKDPDIEIVGMAANGEQAVRMARDLDPDVVTMDVEMPRMDGLAALKIIMEENPCPVLMLSSVTREGADATLKAMDLGAMDFMPKPGSYSLHDLEGASRDLASRVKALARRKAFLRLMHRRDKDRAVKSPAAPSARTSLAPRAASALQGGQGAQAHPAAQTHAPAPRRLLPPRGSFDVAAIGVSTGGPPAVQKILAALPADFRAPILIAQHMPASFTGPFAQRLNGQTPLTVKEAENGEVLRNAAAYVCPGGRHIRLEKKRSGLLAVSISDEPRDALYKPSASALMESVGLTVGRRGLGVILTGMGNDGLAGARVLKEKGGWLIAQSEATCVVYGMPKAVVDDGLADEIVDIDDMAAAMAKFFVK